MNSENIEGIGKAMVQKAEAFTLPIFQAVGNNTIWLECVENEKLMEFYESLGYVKLGISSKGRNENMVIFAKKIQTQIN